jgi:hypothetical protein
MVAKDWIGEIASNADVVRDFCARHNLAAAAAAACEIAARAFPEGKMSLEIESDWDSDAQWLEVVVETPETSTDEVLKCYYAFTREWSRYPDAAARGMIILYFHFPAS